MSMTATERLFERFYYANPAFLNGTSEFRRLSENAGLQIVELKMNEKEPSYARSSALLFWPLLGYERMVNSHRAFEYFRSNILGVIHKRRGGRRP